jgi:hypothetical protein
MEPRAAARAYDGPAPRHVAAARGNGGDVPIWVAPANDGHIIAAYTTAAHAVIAPFAAADLHARFELPAMGRGFRCRTAIGSHFLDYVVHSWNLAPSLDHRLPLVGETVEAALPIARAVPNGPERQVPDASFASARPMTGLEDQPLNQLLTLLGRSPNWPH